MKKLAAISLMGILLFNVLGYRAVFSWLEQHTYHALYQQLDEQQYDESELITLKVPIDQLPYYTNSSTFEKVTGSISIGGHTYQYVERRIYNDSLEVRCIPNAKATQLTNARDLFFQLVNDLQHTNSNGKQSPAKPMLALKNMVSDYTFFDEVIGIEPVARLVSSTFNLYLVKEGGSFQNPQEQPPDSFMTV
ncbi:MAG TPA: hypothetical protein VIK80_06690 [Flavihumibacter sp.]